MKPLPTDNNPLAGGVCHADLIVWLAYKEAKAILRRIRCRELDARNISDHYRVVNVEYWPTISE